MLVKEINVPVKPEKPVTYPVFAKYKDTGEVYMFTSKTTALIITHSDITTVMKYVHGVLEVTAPDWEILPDGYTIQLTQNQQGD